jgi:hypothetical protein
MIGLVSEATLIWWLPPQIIVYLFFPLMHADTLMHYSRLTSSSSLAYTKRLSRKIAFMFQLNITAMLEYCVG